MNHCSYSIGVIGCGHVVETAHLPTLKAMNQAVLWVYDRSDENAGRVARLFGTAHAPFEKGITCLPTPDIILIAVPYGARQEYYDQLERQFKETAVMVEKPVALTLQEHLRIEGLRPRHRMGVCYNRRAAGKRKPGGVFH